MVQRCFLGLVACAISLAGCRSEEPSPIPDSSATPETAKPRLPIADPPLDRRTLLLAVADAASAYALGSDESEQQRELAGKRFEVRLRFGCPGESAQSRRVDYREASRQLRIRVAPEIIKAAPPIDWLGVSAEAVEGFWIYRPWMLRSGCPRADAERPAQEPAAPEAEPEEDAVAAARRQAPDAPRVGIARFFTETDSRTGRRGTRDLQLSLQLPETEKPSATGYELVLSGRLERLPDGRVIVCSGDAALGAPTCIVSAHIDRVKIVQPETGAALGEWTLS